MDMNTGKLYSAQQMDELVKDKGSAIAFKGKIPISEKQYRTLTPMNASERKGWMRNQSCVCGSGRKFKKCCWSKLDGR